ncbi:MAG: S41 family peptidase [Pyrinomonadaceae bacterium]
MTTKKWLCIIILLLWIAAVPFYAQADRQKFELTQSAAEPFNIKSGSSFSASGSKLYSARPLNAREAVTADFAEALQIIQSNHVAGVLLDKNDLTESSVDSMLRMLDPHSNYLDAAEFQNLLGEHESEYSGTGSSISSYGKAGDDGIYIVSSYPGSPAFKAGLGYGDRILAINGAGIKGLSLDAVRDKMRGKRGTTVILSIEKADTKAVKTVELKRDRVQQPTIPNAYVMSKTIGYIDMTGGFSHTTSAELDASLAKLHQQGMTSLVLDLRGNGGGILGQAISAAEKFLTSGTLIVTQRSRSPLDDRSYRSQNRNPETLPLVILVDENTASASEVLAGALQDNDRALIVGEKTFGKGLVQSVLELPSGSGLTLTTAKYFTPAGRSIQRDYSDGSLYDYFNHKNNAVEIGKPLVISRTVTNRKVYGGDGITPDEMLAAENLNSRKISLLDPIFFFTREYINGHIKVSEKRNSIARDEIRQKLIFGESPVNGEIMALFRTYVEHQKECNISGDVFSKEAPFILSTLNYNLSLASSGINSAQRSRTADDRQIAKAIELLPKSAQLALAAKQSRLKLSMLKPAR